MNIKSFAQLKRELKVGTKIMLIDTHLHNHKGLHIEREVVKQQTNAVKFNDGSWLGLGSTGEIASMFSFDGDKFTLSWCDEPGYLTYKILS